MEAFWEGQGIPPEAMGASVRGTHALKDMSLRRDSNQLQTSLWLAEHALQS